MLRTPLTEDDWRAVGLDEARVGQVVLETGTPGWGFTSVSGGDALGVPTWQADGPPGPPPTHRNTTISVDHVVYAVPDMVAAEATIRDTLGLEPRRRAAPRGAPMSFYRAGDAILEVVEGPRGPRLFGVALLVEDIDAAVAAGADVIGEPHPAIQGGRIASAAKGWDGFTVAVYEKEPALERRTANET